MQYRITQELLRLLCLVRQGSYQRIERLDDVRQERDAWRQQDERVQQMLLWTAGAQPKEPQRKRWGRWGRP